MRHWEAMLYALRQVLAILILPATVTLLLPLWIARRYGVAPSWPASWTGWLSAGAGALALGIGLALFTGSLRHFWTEGRGTLAPWDPPRRLVVRGPYRYVRNPMISGVVFLLAGISLALRSEPHAAWTAIFAGLNLLFIPLLEEPDLERRFGEDYRVYRRAVPRFVPRIRPWSGSAPNHR